MSGQRKMNGRGRAARGFTLIELLLVLVILAVLAAVVIPKLTGRVEDSKKGACVTQLNMFKQALNQFEVDNGRFPATNEGLDSLVHPQNFAAPPWRKQIDEVPLDPWGHEYHYFGLTDAPDQEFQITSDGPDGQSGTSDDISAKAVQ